MTLRFTPDPLAIVDPALKEWADERTKELIDAVNLYGGYRSAGRILHLAHSAISRRIATVERRAALAGYAPKHGMTENLPAPFVLKGRSILRKLDPVTGQRVEVLSWDKTTVDDEKRRELELAAYEAMAETLPRLEPLSAAPLICDTDLLTIYPQGDPHAGLASWKEETGSHFDLAEFERLTKAAIDRLVASTPPSALAIYNDKGDLTHADNGKNRTPKSGHELDVQGRHSEVVRVALRCKRHHIARMLEKHQQVIVRIDPGNHDGETALMIALMLGALYENEPRVEVVTSPNPYWYYLFGKNLIGTCHGDGARGANLPSIMANDARQWWGEAEHCLWLVGHVHHKDIKDYVGCTVEYLRTLAAPDAYSHGAGYRSKRDMQAITLHRTWGEVERHTVGAAMVSEMAA